MPQVKHVYAEPPIGKRQFRYRNWFVRSQQPSALRCPKRDTIHHLDLLLNALNDIEKATNHRWEITSYIRKSPSHQYGISIDVSPEFTQRSKAKYAAFNGSDPVLYKRVPLLRSLQSLGLSRPDGEYDVGIFIEPDHLHVQLFDPEGAAPQYRIIKWKQPKPLYGDTYERMKLPLTSQGYSR